MRKAPCSIFLFCCILCYFIVILVITIIFYVDIALSPSSPSNAFASLSP